MLHASHIWRYGDEEPENLDYVLGERAGFFEIIAEVAKGRYMRRKIANRKVQIAMRAAERDNRAASEELRKTGGGVAGGESEAFSADVRAGRLQRHDRTLDATGRRGKTGKNRSA